MRMATGASSSVSRAWAILAGPVRARRILELLRHKRRGVEKRNTATLQFLEQLNSSSIDESDVRQVESQPDTVAETLQIAGFSQFLYPAIRHPAFHPESCRLTRRLDHRYSQHAKTLCSWCSTNNLNCGLETVRKGQAC